MSSIRLGICSLCDIFSAINGYLCVFLHVVFYCCWQMAKSCMPFLLRHIHLRMKACQHRHKLHQKCYFNKITATDTHCASDVTSIVNQKPLVMFEQDKQSSVIAINVSNVYSVSVNLVEIVIIIIAIVSSNPNAGKTVE